MASFGRHLCACQDGMTTFLRDSRSPGQTRALARLDTGSQTSDRHIRQQQFAKNGHGAGTARK